MVRDDDSSGSKWLLELTQNITGQLKNDRAEINNLRADFRKEVSSLWAEMNKNKDACVERKDKVVEKLNELDKRLEGVIVKISVIVGVTVTVFNLLGQGLINYFSK